MTHVRVRVSIARTINLGRYESVRIESGVEFDKNPETKIADAYAKAWALVEEQINQKEKEIQDGMKEKEE